VEHFHEVGIGIYEFSDWWEAEVIRWFYESIVKTIAVKMIFTFDAERREWVRTEITGFEVLE
jgi:hypothetical protein